MPTSRGARRSIPQRTLFRPGSVSKLVTWTAVMQQVEQGKLDLDADVNRYLDFSIPAYEGQPVTMRQIMTHTAGFEEAAQGPDRPRPRRDPALRRAAQALDSPSHLRAGHDAGLFELRDLAGRLHRRARLRRAVRRLCRAPHLRARSACAIPPSASRCRPTCSRTWRPAIGGPRAKPVAVRDRRAGAGRIAVRRRAPTWRAS